MKASRLFPKFIVAAVLIALPVSSQFMSAAPQDSVNLYKEVMDHKGAIQWKAAPDNAIPPDVCTMFSACASTGKLAVLPAVTEGGTKVQRGLFLSPTSDKKEAVIVEHRTSGDVYFFLLGADGNIQKTAYIGIGGTSWVTMSNTLSQPTFAKDKAAWHAWVSKPAAAAPAAPANQDDPLRK